MRYENFELQIQRDGQKYRAQVLYSPVGEASGIFELPFSELELENLFLRVGRVSRNVRGIDSPESTAAKTFGKSLFTAVFNGDLQNCLERSIDSANHPPHTGLRIRLRLDGVPELADLPWEYLYDSIHNNFLTLSVGTPLVRYLNLAQAVRLPATPKPLRVLVMMASPTDYAQLNITSEREKLKAALGGLCDRHLLELVEVEGGTLTALLKRLNQTDYHIFHFIGHGGFDPQTHDGVLIFEDDNRRGRYVSGEELGTILRDKRTLSLAVLNACEGARASRTDPFTGSAQSLLRQGIPAVIAMQFEITDVAAITFARAFYESIAQGKPVDEALTDSRKEIYAQGNGLEWGTPVLYMRSQDGRLFDANMPTIPPEPEPPPENQGRVDVVEESTRIHVVVACPPGNDLLIEIKKGYQKNELLSKSVNLNFSAQYDLELAINTVRSQRDKAILVTKGFTSAQINRFLNADDTRQLEVVNVSSQAGDYPLASLFGDPQIIRSVDPILALRKSILHLNARTHYSIRRLRTKEEFRSYFALRYKVWKQMGYISVDKDAVDSQWELDYTDRTSLPIGAFSKDGVMIGCARLVRGLGEEVPAYVNLIKGMIQEQSDRKLEANFRYPNGLSHPFDVLQSFPSFIDYYRSLVTNHTPKAEVSRVIVDPDRRQHGLGEVIVDSLIALAASEQVESLFLACKSDHQPFYERCGFRAVKHLKCEHFVGVNVPAIAMERQLKRTSYEGRN